MKSQSAKFNITPDAVSLAAEAKKSLSLARATRQICIRQALSQLAVNLIL